jgi:hypothetical protein
MSERMNYRQQPVRRPAPQRPPVRTPAAELARVVLEKEGAFDQFALAMTYTPWQRWGETYDAPKALERGTLFPALDKPFAGRRC